MKHIYLFLSLLFSQSLFAHPTSFADSTGLMVHNGPMMNHMQLNYSFKYWFATGAHFFNRPDIEQDTKSVFATSNFLLKRWNKKNLQANLYGVLGYGDSQLSGEKNPAGLGQLQFDIEDRDYYFLIKYQQIKSDELTELSQGTARFGFTPYVGNFSDIHTWIIFEWQNTELTETQFDSDITPFLRIFYNNILYELGQSFNGATRFNFIAHF